MRDRLHRGFTLVELLVAMAIFSVITVVSLRGITSALDHRKHLEDESRQWRDLTTLMVTLESDLSNAMGGAQLPFLGWPDAAASNHLWLAFSRTSREQSDAPKAPGSVAYRLVNGAVERTTSTTIEAIRHVSGASSGALSLSISRFPVPVRGLALRYLAPSGEWRARWHDDSGELPRAVEIGIELASAHRITRLIALQ